jgi:signal transduction histidine kinase
MLQHSRSGDGKKEPTDLNALADEYFRLAYHGLRAKNKTFNANMETDFDPNLPKVDVIPQDIGRVLLNLITNAFHAVSERKEKEPGYEPIVWVNTRKTTDGVEISVRDNGGGIPEAIRDKIFQPFFTTKPTGEGTGLGLSMSYDIVTKGHGGTLTCNAEDGKGSVFIINLPV